MGVEALTYLMHPHLFFLLCLSSFMVEALTYIDAFTLFTSRLLFFGMSLSFILHGGSIGIYRRIHTVYIPSPFFWHVFVFHPSRLKHGHISCIRTCIVIIDTNTLRTLCRVVFSRLQLHRCRQSPVSMYDSNVVCSVLYFCRRLNCRVTNTILYLSKHYNTKYV